MLSVEYRGSAGGLSRWSALVVIIMSVVSRQYGSAPSKSPENCSPVFLRMTPDQRRRLRIAAAEDDQSYIGLVMGLLDEREKRIERAKKRQGSPLHRPLDDDEDGL